MSSFKKFLLESENQAKNELAQAIQNLSDNFPTDYFRMESEILKIFRLAGTTDSSILPDSIMNKINDMDVIDTMIAQRCRSIKSGEIFDPRLIGLVQKYDLYFGPYTSSWFSELFYTNSSILSVYPQNFLKILEITIENSIKTNNRSSITNYISSTFYTILDHCRRHKLEITNLFPKIFQTALNFLFGESETDNSYNANNIIEYIIKGRNIVFPLDMILKFFKLFPILLKSLKGSKKENFREMFSFLYPDYGYNDSDIFDDSYRKPTLKTYYREILNYISKKNPSGISDELIDAFCDFNDENSSESRKIDMAASIIREYINWKYSEIPSRFIDVVSQNYYSSSHSLTGYTKMIGSSTDTARYLFFRTLFGHPKYPDVNYDFSVRLKGIIYDLFLYEDESEIKSQVADFLKPTKTRTHLKYSLKDAMNGGSENIEELITLIFDNEYKKTFFVMCEEIGESTQSIIDIFKESSVYLLKVLEASSNNDDKNNMFYNEEIFEPENLKKLIQKIRPEDQGSIKKLGGVLKYAIERLSYKTLEPEYFENLMNVGLFEFFVKNYNPKNINEDDQITTLLHKINYYIKYYPEIGKYFSQFFRWFESYFRKKSIEKYFKYIDFLPFAKIDTKDSRVVDHIVKQTRGSVMRSLDNLSLKELSKYKNDMSNDFKKFYYYPRIKAQKYNEYFDGVFIHGTGDLAQTLIDYQKKDRTIEICVSTLRSNSVFRSPLYDTRSAVVIGRGNIELLFDFDAFTSFGANGKRFPTTSVELPENEEEEKSLHDIPSKNLHKIGERKWGEYHKIHGRDNQYRPESYMDEGVMNLPTSEIFMIIISNDEEAQKTFRPLIKERLGRKVKVIDMGTFQKLRDSEQLIHYLDKLDHEFHGNQKNEPDPHELYFKESLGFAEMVIKESKINLDLNRAYELFKAEYEQVTHGGKWWTPEKFYQRFSNWECYGDKNGVVAVRRQRSGYVKLVGMAGSMKSKYKGFKDILALNLPVWGMVTKDIAGMGVKMGMRTPNFIEASILKKVIDPSVFGNVKIHGYTKDGGIDMEYPDVGRTTKYFIANNEYYKKARSDFKNKALEKFGLNKNKKINSLY